MKYRTAFFVAGAVLLTAFMGCSSVKKGFVVLDLPEIDEGIENALTRIEMHDSRGEASVAFEYESGKAIIMVQPAIPLALGVRLADRIDGSPQVFLRRLNRTELQISVAIRASKGVVDDTGATGVIIAADAAPKGGSVSRRQLYYGSASFETPAPADALDREQVRLAIESALDQLADEIFRGFVRDVSPDLVPDGGPGRRPPSGKGLTS